MHVYRVKAIFPLKIVFIFFMTIGLENQTDTWMFLSDLKKMDGK